jgi:hypothetical protein
MRTCSWLGILALLGAANHAVAVDGDTYARVCVTNAQGIRVMDQARRQVQGAYLGERDPADRVLRQESGAVHILRR